LSPYKCVYNRGIRKKNPFNESCSLFENRLDEEKPKLQRAKKERKKNICEYNKISNKNKINIKLHNSPPP